MKTILIIFLMLATPLTLLAGNDPLQKRSKSEWYRHIDERLTSLEEQLASNMEATQEQQRVLTEEMLRLNNKLENRFDKYFLWGYGTLLVVISTIASIIFIKQRMRREEEEMDDFERYGLWPYN